MQIVFVFVLTMSCIIEGDTSKDLLDNISKGKATYQSSTFDIPRELPSKLAVDGSTYGNARTLNASKLSCSHTAIQLNPWWKVDLGREALVHYVRIYLRTDCCSGRYSNVSISTKIRGHKEWKLCKNLGNLYNEKNVVAKCDKGRTNATEVRISIHDRVALTLCEVEVFGVYIDPKKALNFKIYAERNETTYVNESAIAMSKIGSMVATSDYNLTYFIVNGTDEEVDFDVWGQKINGCRSDVYEEYMKPLSYFCIDYKTGEVFITPLFVKERPLWSVKYTLNLRADNKIKKRDQTLVVYSKAQCKLLEKRYEKSANHSSCMKNTTIKLSSLDPENIRKALGGRDFKGGSFVALDVDVAKTISALKNNFTSDKVITLHAILEEEHSVRKIMIKHYPDTDTLHHVYLNEPFVFSSGFHMMKLKFYDESRTVNVELDVRNSTQNIVKYYFVDKYDYCRNEHCKKLTADYMYHISKMAECKHFDKYMLQYKFGYCAAPIFSENPNKGKGSLGNLPIRINALTGGTIIIPGCHFSQRRHLKEDSVHWLKDGHRKIKATFQQTNTTKSTSNLLVYKMDDIVIPSGNYTHQGYYECVIGMPGKFPRISSQRIDVQFTDISDIHLDLKSQKKWDDKLSDETSALYASHKVEVYQKVENMLKKRKIYSKRRSKIRVTGFEESFGKIISKVDIMRLMVDRDERFAACNSLDDLHHIDEYEVKVSYLDCCLPKSYGEEEFKGKYHIEGGLILDNITQPCKYGTRGNQSIIWNCHGNLKFAPHWDYDGLELCRPRSATTYALMLLDKIVICGGNVTKNCVSAENLLHDLNNIITDGSVITSFRDIQLINRIMEKIYIAKQSDTKKKTNECIMEDVVAISSKMLDSQVDIPETEENPGGKMLFNLENFAELVADIADNSTKTIKVPSPNIALSITPVTDDLYLGYHSVKDKRGVLDVESSEKEEGTWNQDTYGWLNVPREAVPKTEKAVTLYVFRKNRLFFPHETKEVQSTVLNIKMGRHKVENLTNRIIMRFRKLFHAEEKGSTCAFWDYSKPSSMANVRGSWSSRGCETRYSSESGVVLCYCDHLTNFALLVDVEQLAYNPLALSIVTYIGCAVSIFGITMTLIFFVGFRNLRTSLPSKIHINLCISLLMLLILFLSTAERTSPRILCQVVASLLLYFQLTTFLWMFIEAFNLYRYFVMVFKKASDTAFLMRAMAVAWGVPTIIVVVIGVSRPSDLGNDKICIVRGNPFYYGMLLPICIIVVINLYILIRVFQGIRSAKISRIGKDNRKNILAQSRVLFAFSILLGSTWIFGLFAIGSASPFFQWLFCILNSLQGFYIFVFYTALNPEAKKEVKKLLCNEEFHIFSTKTEDVTLYRWQISELLYGRWTNHISLRFASSRTTSTDNIPETLL